MKGRVTYARLADKIEQYEKLEVDHPGIKALLRPLKLHCFAACQMKSNKAVLQVAITTVFNPPRTLTAFINLRQGTSALTNTQTTPRSTSGRNKRVAFAEVEYYKQGLKDGASRQPQGDREKSKEESSHKKFQLMQLCAYARVA